MRVARDGSMVTFLPESGAERAWFDDNVQTEPWQWLGSALVVDIRFAAGLLAAVVSEGFEFEIEEG